MPDAIPPFVRDDLHRLGLDLPDDTLATLAAFLDRLLEANKQFNLTAVRDRDEAWRRHIIDSLTVLPGLAELPPESRVIDVGSGGGLPGYPLSIARPDLRFVLLEATAKKCRFLESCRDLVDKTALRVVNDRAESAGQDKAHRERYDAAVCRAIGPMNVLLEYVLPFVKVGGVMLAMKGPSVEAELAAAGDAMMKLGAGEVQVIEAYPEGFGINTVIVMVRKERTTPGAYPRSVGTPKQRPL